MPVSVGSRLGPYEILSAIGAGGMGEVFRARDSKLGREVAIKVLPEAFARDSERMSRFEREAKLLATLSHPHIAAIHALDDSGSTRALVMELAEGPTLADRIASGPIPVEEAIPIARQIADALEYAHEHGVVHRDLKPANIKISRDDSVKVLDFGLAKAVQGEAEITNVSDSPTASLMATRSGVLLGTAAYMAPEQVKGKPVDRRADIWAFGCVFFEMLTGKKAFAGDTVTETLANILKNEPDWSLLPAATPIHVRVLLKRCLQKDAKQRLRDIGDARISLDEVLAGAPEAAASKPAPRRIFPWAITSVAVLAALALALVHFRQKPSAPAVPMRFQIPLPEKASFGTTLALSPDGRHLAFTAIGQDGHSHIWIRDLDSLTSRQLPGTEGFSYPFWSPDGRSLAFHAGGKLERVDISGGSPQVICNAPFIFGGSWNRDGVIVFGSYGGLMKVAAGGGPPSVLIKADHSRGQSILFYPSFLPDGRQFLYMGRKVSGPEVYLGSLDGKREQPSKPLLSGLEAIYTAGSGSGAGHILFVRPDFTLVDQGFDASRGRLQGDPAMIAQSVRVFSISANGVLAYGEGNASPLQLTWFDRQGKALGTVGEPSIYPSPAISPDGSTVAVPHFDGDLWLYDLARGTRSRFTFDGKRNLFPVWSYDGKRIAFSSGREETPAIYQKAVNGMAQEEALDRALSGIRVPMDWSRDGRYLIEENTGSTSSIWVLPLSPEQAGRARKSVPYLNDGFNEINARLSPSGRWMAYDSDETGRDEIFVQTFPKPGGKWQVSTDGATRPVWSRDGKELYFIALDGNLVAVQVKSGSGGSFEAGAAKVLFNPRTGPVRTDTYDVTKDGRFLIPRVVQQSVGGPINVVVNWPALLRE
ncbi:MAG TPA: protein kinase [Bryobacteraceae bacterium]|nr:protein kinase [Bryobacteraceae bacterium]